MKIINLVIFTILTTGAYAGSDDGSRLDNLRRALRVIEHVKLDTVDVLPAYQRTARNLKFQLKSNQKRINQLRSKLLKRSSAAVAPLRSRRETSERLGYYYIDDPKKTFVPISIPRNRYRNVKWIYPSRSNASMRKRNATLNTMSDLISECDELRQKYERLRANYKKAILHEIAKYELPSKISSANSSNIPLESASPVASSTVGQHVPISIKTMTFSDEDTLQKKYIGKSRSEILKELGKPNSTMTVGRIIVWSYKKHHIEALTGKSKDMSITFRDGTVASVGFFDSIILPKFLPLPQ